jgi:Xaa-Pro aminopeptidase
MSIPERIDALRTVLRREGLHAFIIPSTDPHLSEYVAPHWQARAWISGFTGSAGTVVVTLDKAGLWTDSRYFLQAETQLAGTGITLYKEMLPDTPTIIEFLSAELPANASVGIDGMIFAASEADNLRAKLTNKGLNLHTNVSPFDEIWADRPPIPQNPAWHYPEEYAGKSAVEKLTEIRQSLSRMGCEATLLSALDEIAWTLNLRGTDIACNPVVISYLLILPTEAILYINKEKLTPDVCAYLNEIGVSVRPYTEVSAALGTLTVDSILLSPAKTSIRLVQSVVSCRIVYADSPVASLKAVRNSTEIAGLHRAMRKDGVALVRFLKWLEEQVSGHETELSVERKLQTLRAEQPLYQGDSFRTIAGYGDHAAIVHYSASPDSDRRLLPKGFLLLDAGAQYMDGTTDITRTIALGELTDEEKIDYTLVLKGHIALAMAKFPVGTRGAQLDALARISLWQRGMNYLHGTGHGVGHYLNVHEGPQSIRMNENPVALEAGMLTSNEPGIYKAGRHGVRIENLILTIDAGETEFGRYLRFETVTLCPICTKGIKKELLGEEETAWLNDYHRKVFQELAPSLTSEEQAWLRQATKPI